MKPLRYLLPLVAFTLLGTLVSQAFFQEIDFAAEREKARKAMQNRNYKDAYEGLRTLALDPKNDPKLVGQDLTNALQCLQRLNRLDEIDDFREAVIKKHASNWRLLQTAAQTYLSYPHYGYMIAGEFHRGQHRGGGRVVNAVQRDRVRALQLYQQAIPLANQDESKREVGSFYLALSNALLNNRGYGEAWRLQYLTELSELPDYDNGWNYYHSSGGAPVDAEGKPVYHHLPESWEKAETDGQRWRYALLQAMEFNPAQKNQVRMHFANFLHNQFGVQTMRYYGRNFGFRTRESEDKDESGTYALHTLKDNETIAKLASGIKRFELPEEFNFLKIYEQIVEDDGTGYGDQAINQLASIYENRRQYPTAAKYWRKSIAKYGNQDYKQQRLQQIIGNWGQFDMVGTQPAGEGASVEFRFRNGHELALEAHAINVPKLLEDVKKYVKSKPPRLDWQKLNIGNIGHRLVQENQKEYLGRKVASWDLELKPRENHFDKRITITTPLQKSGAYLVTAKMTEGNTSNIILWVSDTAIVKKPLQGKALYYVADAHSGKPIAKAKLELFGYDQQSVGRNKFQILTKEETKTTDQDGQAFHAAGGNNRYQWIATATTEDGRFAYLGYTRVWNANYYDAQYNATKVFAITDRPVYRPKQKVHFKLWVRKAQYDQEDVSQFAGRNFTVEVRNPKGDKVLTKAIQADQYGGVEGEYDLPVDATLGNWSVYIRNMGGGSFRVEEYKKPEFEVNVEAPSKPVMLGEKITAKIEAKYYFGSPVTEAKVKYKVLRTSHDQRWYPVGHWDWLYGRGYWWFAENYAWYPGWNHWGCEKPIPWWWGGRHNPPEVVAEVETEVGADGIVDVEIDTSVAKEIHPDTDHSYQIVAEVTDQSRRTIVGQGKVLVARRPFKVFAWLDRGYYRIGDTVRANFNARTLDGKPVQGDGKLTLLRVTYKDGKPVESPVQTWDLATTDEGTASQQIKASQKGQYRLSYVVTDEAGHDIEGGYLFTIVGEGFDGSEFRFNDLELIPDQRDYQPGETVNLQVNTNRVGGTVLLFVRPANGVYLPPQVIRLDGKSSVVPVDIVKKDMPNVFVEAITVAGGNVHQQTREIVVPPEKRVLNVAVEPSSETYRPGEKATVDVKVTDFHGKPFVGSTVISIYDKSVEYISGGSNVGDIQEFFWKWRRRHYGRQETNLARYERNLALRNRPSMQDLGVFGATVAEELADNAGDLQAEGQNRGGGGGFGAAKGEAKQMRAAAAPGAAADGLAMANGRKALKEADRADKANGEPAAEPEFAETSVRTKFADTALWKGSLTTDKNGIARVELDMPENLTTWKVKVWGMGHGTRVGEGTAEVVTRKNLIVRLQAPRFFLEKDEVVLSANVHNYLDADKQARVMLELEGDCIEPMDETVRNVMVPQQGETRVDWRVKVVREGQAVVRMKALTDEESDAMQMSFPVYVHGMLKMEAWSGAMRPKDNAGQFVINVPAERRPEQSRLEVRYSPTLAGAMVDALPYMVNYPYGCTEQTLNRFLPTVITQKILLDMGLDLQAIKEKRTNLNAQEIGDPAERAKQWKRYKINPVFDEAEVQRMVNEGVKALTQMQLSDGGWGWFSGWGERSYPHTTAVVVHGLQLAQENDVALPPGMVERGVAWLTNRQQREVQKLKNAAKKVKPYKQHADNLDALVYMVLVDAGVKSDDMMNFLHRDRVHISVYGLSMYGIALEKQNEKEKLDEVVHNIEQYLVEDDENQTAYLKLGQSPWWYWYGSEIETQAFYLKLLARTEPKSRKASRLVKYLLNNRKHSTYWNSTRDSAYAIEALAEYLKKSDEAMPDMVVEVWVDGAKKKEVEIKPEDLFTFDGTFVLTGDDVTTGKHTIELKKRGKGPLYWNGYLTNFTLEDYITKAGLEVKVERQYYKLVPVEKTVKVAGSRGQAVDQKVEKYEREPLEDLATLKSGELVEVELVIQSKNDYEYLMFEDMKPAGFEPVEVRSGYNGNDMGAYMELRDNRVSFFVRALARGKHSVSYRMRAEIPGRFSALPARAEAMYAPELKANSDEIKLKVED